MPLLRKTIFTGFSPNITRGDLFVALSYLFFPWKWLRMQEGRSSSDVEEKLKTYFSTPYAFTVDSGRSALLIGLKALGVKPGDEVIVQAYTCIVVINAIRFAGAVPVYVDIDENFCMDATDVKKKISEKTKVLLIQHTFGHGADMDILMDIARDHHIGVIEDCAHSFGATYNQRLLGTFGDIAMFSFGSDKVLSSARGGALIAKEKIMADAISLQVEVLPLMPVSYILRHLLHFPVFYIGRAWYSSQIGKIILGVAKKLGIINLIIEGDEKKGIKPQWQPARFPQALADILLGQLADVDKMNTHRKNIAKIYAEELAGCAGIILPAQDEESIYLRYTIRIEQPRQVKEKMKQRGVLLGDWYDTVIAPKDSDLESTGYKTGTCPKAETAARMSVNLPTGRHITREDAYFITHELTTCLAIPSNK